MSCLLKTQPMNCFGNMHCQVWFSYMPIDFSKVWGLNVAPSSRKIQEQLDKAQIDMQYLYLPTCLPFHLFTLLLTTSPTIYMESIKRIRYLNFSFMARLFSMHLKWSCLYFSIDGPNLFKLSTLQKNCCFFKSTYVNYIQEMLIHNLNKT